MTKEQAIMKPRISYLILPLCYWHHAAKDFSSQPQEASSKYRTIKKSHICIPPNLCLLANLLALMFLHLQPRPSYSAENTIRYKRNLASLRDN
jgi:hypothetical protein